MKKITILLVVISILMVFVGCSNELAAVNSNETEYVYSVAVVKNGAPVSYAEIMGIINEKEEIFAECDANGLVLLKSENPLTIICGRTKNSFGFVRIDKDTVVISLTEVEVNQAVVPKKTRGEFFKLMEHKDSDGDAYFKFSNSHNFSHFWLYGSVPNFISDPYGIDPNGWDSENVNVFSPWQGKKLYIPRRIRWSYRGFNGGRSIDDDLYIVTTN